VKSIKDYGKKVKQHSLFYSICAVHHVKDIAITTPLPNSHHFFKPIQNEQVVRDGERGLRYMTKERKR